MPSWLPVVGGLASAWGANRAAKDANAARAANLAFEKERFDYEKGKNAPLVAGSRALIDTYGSENDVFSPFVGRLSKAGEIASDTGAAYGSNIEPYRTSGLRGVSGFNRLADTAGADNLLELGKKFQNPFLEETYGRGVRDINRGSDLDRRRAAITAAGRGSALSGQAARRAGQIEANRAEKIGDLAARTGSEAFKTGLGEAHKSRAADAALAGSLTGLGGTGLDLARAGYDLSNRGALGAISAPFAPLDAYGSTIGATSALPARTATAPTNPLGAGVGAGLAAYGALARQPR